MKILGFCGGQFGDLIIGTVAARAAKEQLDAHVTYNINKKYKNVRPMLENNAYIDDIYISDGYDEAWPTDKDKDYFEKAGFDRIFNAMEQHTCPSWYLHRHQTAENCLMHGLQPPSDLKITLEKYFPVFRHKRTVAICPFGATGPQKKSLSLDRLGEIGHLVRSLGFIPIQILGPGEEKGDLHSFSGSFFEAVQFCLGCDMVITIDTAMAWIMSGYGHPALGLYNVFYYDGATSAKNWTPIDKNFQSLECGGCVDGISDDAIVDCVRKFNL